MPIECVRPGDQVVARDSETGVMTLARVDAAFTRVSDDLITVRYSNEKQPRGKSAAKAHLTCTGDHPVYVADRDRFVPAAELIRGDQVMLADGTTAFVTDVEICRGPPHGGPVRVYNLSVEGVHTYYAGDGGVLVHNTGGCPEPPSPGAQKLIQGIEARIIPGVGRIEAFSDWMRSDELRLAAKRNRAAFFEAVDRQMRAMYKEAVDNPVTIDGVTLPDLSRVMTHKQLSELCEIANAEGVLFNGLKDLQKHHVAVQKIIEDLANRAYLGVSPDPSLTWSQFVKKLNDDSPAYLMPQATAPNTGMGHAEFNGFIQRTPESGRPGGGISYVNIRLYEPEQINDIIYISYDAAGRADCHAVARSCYIRKNLYTESELPLP